MLTKQQSISAHPSQVPLVGRRGADPESSLLDRLRRRQALLTRATTIGDWAGEGVGFNGHVDELASPADASAWLLRVERTIIRVKGKGPRARAPKSRSGIRVLELPEWLVQLLRERSANLDSPAGPVFPDARGGYRDRNDVEPSMRNIRAGTSFEWVVPHSYRKTVATLLDSTGLSARMIADQLGTRGCR